MKFHRLGGAFRVNLRLMGRGTGRVLVVGALVSLVGGAAYAQRFFREGSLPPRFAPRQMPDSSFVICRLSYTRVRFEESGIGWQTDYPYAEINLTTRYSELTKTRVSRDTDGTPNYYVVRTTDDALFNCPVVFISDAGTLGIEGREIDRLRQYLTKGGFIWADDFWGEAAWEHWSEQIQQVLPPPDYIIEDVPLNDPMLHSMIPMVKIPQITNILFWRQNGGTITSEREDSEEVHMRVIRDAKRRVMVVMTHNTDVADSWEREGEDPGFFLQFSPQGYALGINVLLHIMTH